MWTTLDCLIQHDWYFIACNIWNIDLLLGKIARKIFAQEPTTT
jgi:hypothetical protein